MPRLTKTCSQCLYCDICNEENVCDEFFPWDEADMDSLLEEEMSERRDEFYEQWEVFMSDWDAD